MASSQLPDAIYQRAIAAGWRWDSAWASWKCPVSHLVSDGQVGEAPERQCWLCLAEAHERGRQAAEAQRIAERDQTASAIQRAASAQDLLNRMRKTPLRYDKARRTIVRTPEPEPTLARKGRRYDLDED